MKDAIDFRVDERHAVGHDALNTIIFRALKKDSGRSNRVRWDGHAWEPVRFIYRSKAVLLRDLRELGVSPACLEAGGITSMPDDLREYRRAANASRFAPESRRSEAFPLAAE